MRLIIMIMAMLVASAAQALPGKVERVIDGDSLRVCLATGCEAIRVNGLNTPEKAICKPDDQVMSRCEPCRRGAQLGVIAASRARAMAPAGAKVDVEVIGRDRYGRMVANITLADGSSWAERMIRDGLAAPYPCPNGRCSARPRPWCPS